MARHRQSASVPRQCPLCQRLGNVQRLAAEPEVEAKVQTSTNTGVVTIRIESNNLADRFDTSLRFVTRCRLNGVAVLLFDYCRQANGELMHMGDFRIWVFDCVL